MNNIICFCFFLKELFYIENIMLNRSNIKNNGYTDIMYIVMSMYPFMYVYMRIFFTFVYSFLVLQILFELYSPHDMLSIQDRSMRPQ